MKNSLQNTNNNNKPLKITQLYKIWNGKNFFLFNGKLYIGSEYYYGLLTNLSIIIYIILYFIFVINVRIKKIILILIYNNNI